MSENIQAPERAATARPQPDAGIDLTAQYVPIADGRVARIDSAQALTSPPGFAPSSGLNDAFAESPRQDDELLSQASQLVDHLRSQFADLRRRDNVLAAQLQQVEQERQSLHAWQQQAQLELQSKADALRQRETALALQLAEQDRMTATLRQAQDEVDRKRQALDSERIRLAAEAASQLDADRERLRQAIATVEADRGRLQAEFDQKRATLDESIRAKLQEIEAAKARVREDVTEEVLTTELRSERDTLLREREEFDRQRAAWTEQRDREQAQLAHEREIQDAAASRIREELLAQKQQQVDELEARRREQDAALQQAQDDFARQRDEQLQELKHERAVLENRLRFQQEHLNKARQEIETLQSDFRREAQRTRGQLEEGEAIIRLRQSQLDRVRALLEERERSVNREREMLFKSQRAFEQFTEHDRERLKLERDDWEQERSIQTADLRRQQDMLALHAQNLEGRRERLDKLRAELEETHRTTLEMRMAIEEAWAQMTQACGEQAAKQRIEAAQQQLSGHYRLLRETLTEQRCELDELQKTVRQQRDELRAEQQTLTDWTAEQDRKLREREASLRHQAEQLDVRESAWRSASQRWINEKIEAEAVIRDLLQQLSALTEPASPSSLWPSPAMPTYE